ncbi:hypothetical protein, partial [Paraburkholderia fynbosensis]|uniref:hypothetical protein n=1 Tax=Paraburkholderia fynbosensis TaxID=1200993 RepID=UPI001C2DFD27
VLSAAQLTHHDESLPSIDVFQDTEQSARRQTFSTQSRKQKTFECSRADSIAWPFLADRCLTRKTTIDPLRPVDLRGQTAASELITRKRALAQATWHACRFPQLLPTKRSLASTIRSPTLLKQIFRPISRIAIFLTSFSDDTKENPHKLANMCSACVCVVDDLRGHFDRLLVADSASSMNVL